MFKYFEIHLVEHCNLNCRSCDNFSPLAEESYLDINAFIKEMSRVSELAKNEIKKIRLLGGEPLLHPLLTDFLVVARKAFPTTEILLTTNGILLSSMSDAFWKICNENNITIEITYYPVKIDRDAYKNKANTFNVKVIPFNNQYTETKVTHRNPINEKGDQNASSNYARCYQRGNCITLKDGKIFPCTCIPNICHFNKYFNKNISITEKDYIDIYKVQSINEINEFLKNAVPFCSYCDVSNRSDGAPWSTTKYEIQEWFNER